MKNRNPQTKDLLINKLIGLINGEIALNDLRPKDLCIKIGHGVKNIYEINDKQTTKEQFDEARAMQAPQAFTVSYEDDYNKEVMI